MRQTRTRILSMLLALMMCLSLLPMTAMAATGEPTLFLDPNQDPNSNIFFTYADQRTSILSGTISGSTKRYTVRLFLGDNVTDTPIESRMCDKGTLTIDLSAHGRYGYELISISPDSTAYTVSPDKKLTLTLTTDTDIFIKPVLLDDNFTFTFNMNGAGEDRVYPVKYGDAFPTPPETPSLPGYRFLGWYSGRLADDHYLHSFANINAYDSKVVMDYTFYAMWEKEEAAAAVRVNFYPNGGRITEFKGKTVPAPNGGYPFTVDDVTGVDMSSGIGWTNTESSGLLTATALPSVEREGYTFDGWYITGTGPESNLAWDGKLTDFSKLEKYTSDRKFTIGVELAAKWIAADTCKVTFNSMVQGRAPEHQTVPKGSVLTLPQDPVLNGYTFCGWFTGDVIGDYIYNIKPWYAGDRVTSDITLYADWDSAGLNDTLKGLTYRFGNNSNAYGYGDDDKIPLERYKFVFGDDELAEKLFKEAKPWRGSCFGMSSTSGMMYESGNGVNASSFRSDAKRPHDLVPGNRSSELGLTTQQFIEAMQIAQKGTVIQKDYRENRDNLSALCAAVESIKTNGPVTVAMFQGKEGHAVVGYAIESVSSEESHLKIYDCNYPCTDLYITLYKNASGQYTGWYYYLGKDIAGNDVKWGSSYPDCWISYVPYEDYYRIWTNRPVVYETEQSLMFMNVNNATIKDGDGNVTATITNGTVTSSRSDVYQMVDVGFVPDAARTSAAGAALWLPADEVYTITTTSKNLEATLVNVDQSAAVITSASSVTFAVNDDSSLNYVQINQAGAKYDITLSSTLDQGHDDVQLTGTTASGGVSLAQISGNLYATGVDSGATLKVDGKNAATATLSSNMPDIGNLGATTPKPTGDNPFTDVKAGAYYYNAVLWAVQQKVTSGTSATTFSPDASCTRGQIVTFLWRAAGSPKPNNAQNPFTDVKSGTYYYDAVLWAVEKGITSGTSATTFSPDASCTRGQTVTFLWRAAGSPKAASSSNPFSDVKAGTYYYDAVLWAVEKKVTSGTSATTFSPDATVTRGQTVTFLYRSQGK